ncbi:MAG: hypothetical protein LQ342_007228, partial [Letrouitia transgressa]
PQDPEIPLISNGTLWSNEIDTFWFFGGTSSGQTDHDNTLWRFNSSLKGQKWTQLHSNTANVTGPRPADGAGCNVRSRSKGYYLGGIAKNRDSSEIKYLHSMTIFDMNAEKTSVIDVPPYVPIIVQPTTDREGGPKTVTGSDIGPKIGIPEARDHMCTVVGNAPDKSSHNLYVFGGKNNTNSLEDIWALSLPR